MLFTFYCHGAQSCLLHPKLQMSFDFSSLHAPLIPLPGFCLFSLLALWCLSWRMGGFSRWLCSLREFLFQIQYYTPKIQYYSPIHVDKSMPTKYWSCKYSSVEITYYVVSPTYKHITVKDFWLFLFVVKTQIKPEHLVFSWTLWIPLAWCVAGRNHSSFWSRGVLWLNQTLLKGIRFVHHIWRPEGGTAEEKMRRLMRSTQGRNFTDKTFWL